MKIGPRYKICKRLGSGVFQKCQTPEYELSKSRGNSRGRRGRQSEYGEQLLEKQKVRFTYGLTEDQFSRWVDKAISSRDESPIEALFSRLETRLDNVVFRLGLAKSRRQARQMVSHGHIDVNGERLSVPSANVEEGDVVSVRDRSKDKAMFQNLSDDEEGNYTPPAWLAFDEGKLSGEIAGRPDFDPTTETFDLTAVIEFYSR